jgi:hypothetical protein
MLKAVFRTYISLMNFIKHKVVMHLIVAIKRRGQDISRCGGKPKTVVIVGIRNVSFQASSSAVTIGTRNI